MSKWALFYYQAPSVNIPMVVSGSIQVAPLKNGLSYQLSLCVSQHVTHERTTWTWAHHPVIFPHTPSCHTSFHCRLVPQNCE